jgi:type I restriction enzyme S subunit
VKRLKYIAFLKSGETISYGDFTEDGYPVYGGNGFRGYTTTYTNEGEHILIGRQGALCGNINYAKGKFFASEHAIVVYPLNNESILWLGEAMDAANLNRFSQSAAQPGIAVNIIKNEQFPYPPLKEQYTISKYLEKQFSKITKAVNYQQTQIEKLKEYKSVLIDSAVTGKIKVSELPTNRDKL